MSKTKKVILWWWPWESEKVEGMLEGMALQGWKLLRCGGLFASFVFETCEPAKVRYCLDFQEKEKPEYLTLLQDAGWKLEHKGSGWYLWSMAYDGPRPELYTDTDSLIRRSNSILGTLTAVFAAQIPLMTVSLQHSLGGSPFVIAIMIFWGLVVAVLAGSVIGTALGVRKLKRRKALEKG